MFKGYPRITDALHIYEKRILKYAATEYGSTISQRT